MNKFWAIFLAVALFASPAVATTESYDANNRVLNLSAIDEDWQDTEGKRVDYIIFHPGAADDEIILRAGTITGPIIARVKCQYAYPAIVYFDKKQVQLAIDYSECTLSSGHMLVVNFSR